jgi:3-oxoacyl-[acyl-carrier-protein] synthase-1
LYVALAITGAIGPSFVVSTACSSSAKVFGDARRLIATGLCDAVVVGGVDTLAHITLRGFHGLEVLSASPCRPFSRERTGINIGEGAAFVLLERPGPDVAAIGDVHLLGVGESSDAHHMTAPHPEGLGARLAMMRALDQAKIPATEIDQINAHATATRLNDASEGRAIRELLGERVKVVATKGYTGHMLGAAGATEAVFIVDGLARGRVPASRGAEPLDETIGVDVSLRAEPFDGRFGLSNSFAFGGSNVSLLFGRCSPGEIG